MNENFYQNIYSKEFTFDEVGMVRFEKVLKLIGKNKKVLDLGCWDGSFMELIKNQNNQVVGVEIVKEAIKKARKKGFKVYFLSLNENWTKKIKEKFDVVFAGDVIEHLFDTDKFLQNIREVLKKNGSLVLTTPNLASLGRRLLLLIGKNPLIETTARGYDVGHIRYFTKETLFNLLKENNFQPKIFESTVVNFSNTNYLYSKILAKIFPTLGSHLIVKAKKI